MFDVWGGGLGCGGRRGAGGQQNCAVQVKGARAAWIGACEGDFEASETAIAEHAGHLNNAGESQ